MSRLMQMLVLILAGEMVFSLPFHPARFFRPTFLETFQLSNTQLGDLFATYGITAMASYLLGGWLVDRFQPRKLISISLLATAAGGLYLLSWPGETGLKLLFAYWGVTTILLFWAALISATRDWGGEISQGKAFGLLDGGRGVVAAAVAWFAVLLLGTFIPDNSTELSEAARRDGMHAVILVYTAATAFIAALSWFFIPGHRASGLDTNRNHVKTRSAKVTGQVRNPAVWAIAGVIVAAYCAYKGLDNYGLYAVQVLGMSEVEAARYFTLGSWLRPFAALLAGWLADRVSASRVLSLCFALLAVSYLLLCTLGADRGMLWLVHGNIMVSFAIVFALRGIYFALIEEVHVPASHTGAIVGLVSFVGFTPEIFFGPLTGRILDAAPGATGHRYYFAFLAVVAFLGLLFSLYLLARKRQKVP